MNNYSPIPPPRWPLRLLRRVLNPNYWEELEGDMVERFHEDVQKHGLPKARRRYIWGAIKLLRPALLKKLSGDVRLNQYGMFKHHLTLALRNFRRQKMSFFINLIGLSTGLASFFLIHLWVQNERSYDKFHSKGDRLFRVMRNIHSPSAGTQTTESNSLLLPEALVSELPEIEHVVPCRPAPPGGILQAVEKSIEADGWFAGSDFFNVFSYDLLIGNATTLLDDKSSMVLSDEMAIKLFGSVKEALNKTVVWDMGPYGDTYSVSGVFRQRRADNSRPFDFLVGYQGFLAKTKMDVTWHSNPILTYLTLHPEVDLTEFNLKLNSFYKSKRDDIAVERAMFLQRYSNQYLYGQFENGYTAGGRIDHVILFSVIAAFILLVACINFVNLSTARTSNRLKEVGIKKVIGARRRTLTAQYLVESILVSLCSLVAALGLAVALLPQFSLISGQQLNFFEDTTILLYAVVSALVVGFVAGSFPAFYLSGFRPLYMMKGRLVLSRGSLLMRKGLVVLQFAISCTLILSVAVIYLQIDYVNERNLGYSHDHVLTIERQGKLNESLESFLTETGNIPGVVSATSASQTINSIEGVSWGHEWEGQQPGGEEIEFAGLNVSHDFLKTMGIAISQGRSFSRDYGNERTSIILNQTAIDVMEMDDPIGKWIQLFGTKKEIVGVVEDFHFQSMHEEIKPIFIVYNPKYTSKIFVKVRAATEQRTMESLDALYGQYNPNVPLEITFLDEEYQRLYISEKRVAGLSRYFAAIAVIISCLGLFGLTAYNTERRFKEIGIRKVLGSSSIGIVRLMTVDTTAPVLVAILLSLPVGFFIAKSWLADFAYKIDLSWWLFVLVGGLGLLLASLTVSIQVVKASFMNPVDTLRNE